MHCLWLVLRDCKYNPWTILDSSSFPLFHSGLVFHELVCPLTVVLPQIATTPFSYPVFFCLFHALLDVVHFLIFLRSIRFKCILSQFSPSIVQIKNFSYDQGFSPLMCAKDLTGSFSHYCVEGGDHWVHVCIFIVHDGDRCKVPAYHTLEGFQHIGIFQLFKVKLESCVFWLADFFQTKVEGHHQQVVVTSNVCSWKALCSGMVHSWSEALLH